MSTQLDLKKDVITVIISDNTELEAPAPAFSQNYPQDKLQVIRTKSDSDEQARKESLAGLKEAEGEFVIFLDEGDEMPEDLLALLAEKLKDPAAAFAMPSAESLYLFQSETPYFHLAKVSGKLSAANGQMPVMFPTELHGILFRTEYLIQAGALEEKGPEAEKKILLQLLEKHPEYYFEGSLLMRYARRRECDPRYNPYSADRDWYYSSVKEFLLPALEAYVPGERDGASYLKSLAVYMVHMRLQSNLNFRHKHVFEREEAREYMSLLSEVYRFIPVSRLADLTQNPCKTGLRDRIFDVRIKKQDFLWYPEVKISHGKISLYCDGELFADKIETLFSVDLLDYMDGKLELDGSIDDFYADGDLEVVCRFGEEEICPVYNQIYAQAKMFGITFSRMKTMHFTIPVEGLTSEKTLNIYLKKGKEECRMSFSFPGDFSRFSKDFIYSCWRFGKYYAFWNKKGIHVRRKNHLVLAYKELRFLRQLWLVKGGYYRKAFWVELLNYILQPWFMHRKIWLFQDKIYKGGDCSEYIYKYADRQKDGIKCYYLMDEGTIDDRRLRKEGYRPLKRGSLKNKLVFLNADLVIASNSRIFAFNDYLFKDSLAIRGRVKLDVACVQHGLSVQKLAVGQKRTKDNTKLYFCASKYEIENLSKPAYDYLGYGRNYLFLTGIPRYDGLKNRAEKVILLSPTWRMQIAIPIKHSGSYARDYNPAFKETDYYRVYNGLVNNERFLEAAKKYGYKIKYILHPVISPQLEDFQKNDQVEFIPSLGEMSYEDLFCEGALLITDFSGVQFDFAYMRKPVVYFHHHDLPQHYEEGAFFYESMGFGEICRTTGELIDTLCRYMQENCEMPEKYRKRADDFFAFSDNGSCARIYQKMLEYSKEKMTWR